MKNRVFLSGPMSGRQDLNYPAFHAEAARLRDLGHDVANPAENPEPPCKSWEGYMRMAVAQLVTCDVICLLPGWADSRGAMIERRLAQDLRMKVIPAGGLVCV